MSEAVFALLKDARALVWPKQEQLPGFVEGYIGLDRVNGAMVWATFWDTVEHANALGVLPEMIASGEKFRAQGLTFEPITTHELI